MGTGYKIVDSPLGRLLAAATERGICMVSLGDVDDYLVNALRREFPDAVPGSNENLIQEAVQGILGYLSGGRICFDLPLDIRTTLFRMEVYETLKAIPYGAMRTYKEIAASIGKPAAVRAVGSACASNPVSLVVPCHRVVRKDGGMGGYRWGIERKKKLLEMEKNAAARPF
ncbi:MAG: methylated-DNA--[protein]-cysteine S-methyltransferase [Bacillota bacterium]